MALSKVVNMAKPHGSFQPRVSFDILRSAIGNVLEASINMLILSCFPAFLKILKCAASPTRKMRCRQLY